VGVGTRVVASVDRAACSSEIRKGIAEATTRTRATMGVAATMAKIDMDVRTAAADRVRAAIDRRTDPTAGPIAARTAGPIRAAVTTDRPIRAIRISNRTGTRIRRRIVRETIGAVRRMNGARTANCGSVTNARSAFGKTCGRAARRVAARATCRTRQIRVIEIRASVIHVIEIHAAAQDRSRGGRRMNGDVRAGVGVTAVSNGVTKDDPICATN